MDARAGLSGALLFVKKPANWPKIQSHLAIEAAAVTQLCT